MSTEMPGVSLSANGLRCVEGLDCPEGDYHEVNDQSVILAAKVGGGQVVCRKCGATLTLDKA